MRLNYKGVNMEMLIICGKVYTKKERAKEILFKNENIDNFVKSFELDGVEYFKKVK